MKKIFLILFVIALTYAKAQYKIDGLVTYDNSVWSPFQQTEVNLKDLSDNIVATVFTDNSGYYYFINIPNGSYKIELKITYKWGGGNPSDALLVNRYFIQQYNFYDELMKKAADVNIDNNKNTLDALLINRRFVQLISSFKAGDWLFDDNNVTVDGQDIHKYIKVICTGDVDGSYCPTPAAPALSENFATSSQIVWNWLAVAGAAGYKYNNTNNYSTANDAGSATSFTQTGLTCNTSYNLYVWAYSSCGSHSLAAIFSQSTSECSAFICGNNFTDTRNSKSYKTVKIGDQCWFRENLNIGTRINGSSEQSDNGTIEKYCYNDDENNCDIYGGLYKWDEAMQYVKTEGTQGVCPSGWHIPTENDLALLITYLGGNNVAGGKMKETGTTHWTTPNTDATNSSGFTGLAAGFRFHTDKKFYYLGNRTYYWGSSEGTNTAYGKNRGLLYNFGAVSYGDMDKGYAFSIRCIKD